MALMHQYMYASICIKIPIDLVLHSRNGLEMPSAFCFNDSANVEASHKATSGTPCAPSIAAGVAALPPHVSRGCLDENLWRRKPEIDVSSSACIYSCSISQDPDANEQVVLGVSKAGGKDSTLTRLTYRRNTDLPGALCQRWNRMFNL